MLAISFPFTLKPDVDRGYYLEGTTGSSVSLRSALTGAFQVGRLKAPVLQMAGVAPLRLPAEQALQSRSTALSSCSE
jgi:hypothetical protein